MAPYADCCDGGPLRILDQHNAVYLAVERMAAGNRNPLRRKLLGIEANNLKRFEFDTCARFDKVVWVSEADRLALQDQTRTDFIIPIATDPSEKSLVRNNRQFRVTFLGGMHWPPNAEGIEWFATHVWPTIAAAAPSALLTVIGKGAPSSLKGRTPSERVEVTGYVDDVQPYLEETAVFVVPLLSGAGMRVKILDAWCSGLPVVSTTVGAEGIAATDREDMLIADSAESFAEATVRLLQDRSLARRIGEAGRATVERSYDWRQVYQAWDNVYR
jgi:glycosyltransferase involved in cell wall biosynthesis